MRRIETMIPRSDKFKVIGVLEELGLHFTHYDTRGSGKNPPATVELHRDTGTMSEEFNENATTLTVVADSMADKVVEKSLNSTFGGEGIVFVYQVKDTIDIKSAAILYFDDIEFLIAGATFTTCKDQTII
jgi:nitrogen regulatory protein PII